MSRKLSSESYEAVRPVWIEVSLDAITKNIEAIRQRVKRPVKMIIPVKADAYGHGAVGVGKHLESLGVDGLATANVDDAIALREAGVRLPIQIYASQLPAGTSVLREYDLTPTIYNMEAAKALSESADGVVNVHVKVDAGLGRIGIKLSKARDFIRRVNELENIHVEGVYTHIAFSNATGESWSRRRLPKMISLIEELKSEDGIDIEYAQASASSTIICDFPDSLNTISPGHLVFGLCPVAKEGLDLSGLTPALASVKGKLIHIVEHAAGEDIAVSGYMQLKEARRTGVILFGLDNGFKMPVDQDAFMLCRGQRCQILSVTAEYSVIDLTNLNDACIGDEVVVIGRSGSEEITLDQVAKYLNTSSVQFMVDLRRLPFRHF